MTTSAEIGKMNFGELKELLTRHGYKDERGYKITIEFPEETGLSRIHTLTSYGLAAGYISRLMEGYKGCNLLVESQYETGEYIAFWIEVSGTYTLPKKPTYYKVSARKAWLWFDLYTLSEDYLKDEYPDCSLEEIAEMICDSEDGVDEIHLERI